ncbi:PQQ-dependent dehydrogenase, methanol/ethanol family [Novosphingobium sp. 9U]|uniref:PQQ-dependent dehydrogenase, methanol/ethanol family n=1 Tax=Novosphingobium sp. 9U TaxID=2653158 RepID=UPI0012EF27BA|nr:PQQ-dependent dehydrogenase, methanol/ethanol family [Novosphingobium sp. 9U]VWX53317.1 Quinohemoprotein alcohol dehydrogenase ADH IIB [Novosphingobium sp. 9U]
MQGHRKRVVLAVLALLSACGQRGDAPGGTGEDWLTHGGADDQSGYSRLQQVDTGNVSRLGLAWALELPGEVSLEATPLAVGGTLYFTGSHSKVYAADALSGKLRWSYDPEVWRYPKKIKIVFPVHRGCAYADGLVFSGTLDGRLLALDAATGALRWSVATVEQDDHRTITGAPITFDGLVLIGHGGADYGERGYVTAYNQKTGQQRWRFYTVPGSPQQNAGDPAMQAAAKTWGSEFWKHTGGGGTVWNGMTYDAELDRVYLGTGNSGPWDPVARDPGAGDNLYLASIVALEAKTGKYLWHYQVNPREAWDYKATPNIVAATLEIAGKPRKVLMQAPTNGFFYVIDRETGRPISAEKLGKVTWASRIDLKTGRPVENAGIRYEHGDATIWPGQLGGHNWQSMAFSPKAGLVYVPTMQLGMHITKHPAPDEISFGGFAVSPVIADARDGKGALVAWDPVTQKARWRVDHRFLWNGGPLATAGGLVFQGAADGLFTAYDAADGKRLWQFDAGLGIVSSPISYVVSGKQYVAVLIGYGGSSYGRGLLNAGWKFGAQPRRLLAFALDGKAQLPSSAPPDLAVHPLDDPTYRIDTASLQEGRTIYTWHCAICHGVDVISSGAPAPDLRESAIALSREGLRQVVLDGVLVKNGMPAFEELQPKDVDGLYNFIRAEARKARPMVRNTS